MCCILYTSQASSVVSCTPAEKPHPNMGSRDPIRTADLVVPMFHRVWAFTFCGCVLSAGAHAPSTCTSDIRCGHPIVHADSVHPVAYDFFFLSDPPLGTRCSGAGIPGACRFTDGNSSIDDDTPGSQKWICLPTYIYVSNSHLFRQRNWHKMSIRL